MASLEAACHSLASDDGQARLARLLEQTIALRAALHAEFSVLRLFEPASGSDGAGRRPDWDPCKLFLTSPLESGEDWGCRLEAEQALAFESVLPEGVLYLANLGLEASDFEAFRQTLLAEDRRQRPLLAGEPPPRERPGDPTVAIPELVMTPREAFFAPGRRLPAEAALGRTAKETVVHCPPGIPVLLPGERIRPEHLPLLPGNGVLVVA
jgi:arginine/lysine/ornithine decarboxylase